MVKLFSYTIKYALALGFVGIMHAVSLADVSPTDTQEITEILLDAAKTDHSSSEKNTTRITVAPTSKEKNSTTRSAVYSIFDAAQDYLPNPDMMIAYGATLGGVLLVTEIFSQGRRINFLEARLKGMDTIDRAQNLLNENMCTMLKYIAEDVQLANEERFTNLFESIACLQDNQDAQRQQLLNESEKKRQAAYANLTTLPALNIRSQKKLTAKQKSQYNNGVSELHSIIFGLSEQLVSLQSSQDRANKQSDILRRQHEQLTVDYRQLKNGLKSPATTGQSTSGNGQAASGIGAGQVCALCLSSHPETDL